MIKNPHFLKCFAIQFNKEVWQISAGDKKDRIKKKAAVKVKTIAREGQIAVIFYTNLQQEQMLSAEFWRANEKRYAFNFH